MHRLGFAVRVLGRPRLRAYDARRPTSQPHLSVSLVYLRDIIAYLVEQQISFYRLPSGFAPFLSASDAPQFQRQLLECELQLGQLGELIRQHQLRLSIHLDLQLALGSAEREQRSRAIAELSAQAALLDALGLGPEAVLIVHLVAPRNDLGALDSFAQSYLQLAPNVRRRVVLEHDERVWSLGSLLPLHEVCGVPLVFDYLHHMLNNPEGIAPAPALGLALATWPTDSRPKIHFSSPRTEAHLGPHGSFAILPPRPGQHADFINPFEFAALIGQTRALPEFDIMLEAKAGDLALLRLRDDLGHYAPDLRLQIA
jgi:UV DNA damage endonuclease